MSQQVLMVVLLLLVDQSADACIFDEINLRPCWRKDILRVKDRALISNCNFYEFVRPICHHRVVTNRYAILFPLCFLLRLIYLSAAAYFSEEINWGQCWDKDILRAIDQEYFRK